MLFAFRRRLLRADGCFDSDKERWFSTVLHLCTPDILCRRTIFSHRKYEHPEKSKAFSDKLKGEIPAQNGEEWKKVGRRCNRLRVCCNAFLLFFEPLPYFFATSSRKNEQKNGDFRTQIPPHRIYTHKKAQILTIIASICAFILPVFPSAKFENRFTPRMKGSFEHRDGNGGNIYANIGKKIAEDYCTRTRWVAVLPAVAICTR